MLTAGMLQVNRIKIGGGVLYMKYSAEQELSARVNLGQFGHQVNSDTYLQTVEFQMRRLLMSRFIRIFTVFLVITVNLFFISIIEL